MQSCLPPTSLNMWSRRRVRGHGAATPSGHRAAGADVAVAIAPVEHLALVVSIVSVAVIIAGVAPLIWHYARYTHATVRLDLKVARRPHGTRAIRLGRRVLPDGFQPPRSIHRQFSRAL